MDRFEAIRQHFKDEVSVADIYTFYLINYSRLPDNRIYYNSIWCYAVHYKRLDIVKDMNRQINWRDQREMMLPQPLITAVHDRQLECVLYCNIVSNHFITTFLKTEGYGVFTNDNYLDMTEVSTAGDELM